MNTNVKKGTLRTFVFSLCVLASAAAVAHGGGGGWHGGGGGWHGGGGGWHGGGWHGGGWSGGGVVIGAPYYYGNGGCQTIRVCNQYRNCWLEQSCY